MTTLAILFEKPSLNEVFIFVEMTKSCEDSNKNGYVKFKTMTKF